MTLLRKPIVAVTTAVLLGAGAVALALAVAEPGRLDDRFLAVPLVVVMLTAGAFAVLGWGTERARREELETEHGRELARIEAEGARREAELRDEGERLASEIDATRRDSATERERHESVANELRERLGERERALERLRAEHEAALEERDRDLAEERRTRVRAEQSRREEKEWALHLRNEVVRLQRERGALGDLSDVRALVLHTAVTLVGAEKGLLLSREDVDGDRLLDLVCHEGFESDPSDSAVAQRFAREVIERDTTIREDDEPEIADERRTAADAEIRNLLAIPIYIADDFAGVVVLANKEGGFDEYDDEVLLALGDHAGAMLHNTRLQEELRTSYVGTVRVLADAIEAKDRFLRGHADEVAAYVSAVARELGFDAQRREELMYSSLLHDVGKIGISERILLKPAALTPEERSIVELHPRIGYRLIRQVPALRVTEMAILHHHEHWDGSGYPAGLSGDDIPLDARIIAVADAFSAMTADRPYRPRMTLDEACDELERCGGTQFDPAVVRLFVAEVRRQPPRETEGDALHEALADPEIDARRDDDDAVLGAAPFTLTDSLTLLYSRRHLHETAAAQAERAGDEGRRFSILLVEVVDLAEINREEGYAAGDLALQRVARAVERAAATSGATACRYGGRRLALVVPGDEDAARRAATAVEDDIGERPVVRTATAVWQPGDSGDHVVERARTALAAQGPAARVPLRTGGPSRPPGLSAS